MRDGAQKLLRRGAGVLMPITSLPSPYGIGTLGEEACAFIDFVAEAGLIYWQVLPLGPTGYGDSPYQSFSSFAGNPYMIDLRILSKQGLLTEESLSTDTTQEGAPVDYGELYCRRFSLLRKTFCMWKQGGEAEKNPDYHDFWEKNDFWLEDYTLFMALKIEFDEEEWLQWPMALRKRYPQELKRQKERLSEEMEFWGFVQYQFWCQWQYVLQYAHTRGIQIIGDIPMYIAMDSADAWVLSQQLLMDDQCKPSQVAGVPPDLFSQTGQLWGNPLYDWEAMKKNDYAWWRNRIRHLGNTFDVIRVDHFLGVARYYCVEYGSDTAMGGGYRRGPGRDLLRVMEEEKGGALMVAEDLGVANEEVEELLKEYGYPGMKVILFAFDGDPKNPHLPENQKENVLYYGGTHDNEPILGFLEEGPPEQVQHLIQYFGGEEAGGVEEGSKKKLLQRMIEAVFRSPANVVIFQMQDFLGLGSDARTNKPSTVGENWKWRMKKGQLTVELQEEIKGFVRLRDEI